MSKLKISIAKIKYLLITVLLLGLITGCSDDLMTYEEFDQLYGKKFEQSSSQENNNSNSSFEKLKEESTDNDYHTESNSSNDDNSTQEISEITEETENNYAEDIKTYDDELTVTFYDVGQGDCTIITCGNDVAVIDAGDNNKGTTLQRAFNNMFGKDIKYFIVTHRDSDHAGGADVIIEKFNIETFITPTLDYDTRTFEDVVNSLKYKNYKNTIPVVGNTYPLGSATITILGPVGTYEDDNNNSVVVRLDYGETSFLFMGDAEEEAENAILNSNLPIKANVLKLGHHGSSSSTSQAFLDSVNPEYAVISCGLGNNYGHPTEKTLNKLKNKNISVYRTDEQGTISVTSDGKNLYWSRTPSTSWTAGVYKEQ